LQRWDYDGILVAHRPKTSRSYDTQDPYDQAMGLEPEIEKRKVVCYFRVSGYDQKEDLNSQKKALDHFVMTNVFFCQRVAVRYWQWAQLRT
jgi:predicted site-specific integrase-resolvase